MSFNNTNEKMELVLVDCDAGIDDAWGLLMLLAGEQKFNIKIIGITCVYGNTSVEQTTRNVLRILQSANRFDVPVFKGAKNPLISFDLDSRKSSVGFFGKDGFGDAEHEDMPDETLISEENGIAALNRIVNEHEGKVSLLCLGPLTNIALAIRTYPTFEQKVKELIIMGGNYQAVGNTTDCAEFNFHADPEAANIVLGSAIKLKTLVPWETCSKIAFSLEWRDNVLGSCQNACIQLMNKIEKLHRKRHSFLYWPSCDQVVAALLLTPSSYADSDNTHVTVELHGYHTRGQVVVSHRSKRAPNVKLVKKVNQDMLGELLLRIHDL